MATKRTDYPDDIEVQAWLCKVEAEMRCVNCDALHGEEYTDECGTVKRKVVTAAHLFHDASNRRPRLVSLCRQCHRGYDARTGPNRRQKKEPS